jgi:SnoaL-like protein
MEEKSMKKISRLAIAITVCMTLLVGTPSAQQVPSQGALDELVKTYSAAWNEPDAQHRRELLEKVWASGGTYTDPQSHVEGREALVEHIGRFLKNSPGARIIQSSHADFHHGMFRFTWKFVGGDGKTLIEGIDFGVLGPDGKLQRIVGFFGPIKPL